MAELKTRKSSASVSAFLAKVEDPERRKDCHSISMMMREATGAKPAMWGSSIVGFGDYHYEYASGREADWFEVGFSPRKRDITLYLTYGFDGQRPRMKKLGKHKTGKACLYIQRLADVDAEALRGLIDWSVGEVRKRNAKAGQS